MSERPRRPNPRLDNFETNKAAKERRDFEDSLYGESGTTQFSEEDHARIREADAYERHLESLMNDTRSTHDRGLDRLESSEVARGDSLVDEPEVLPVVTKVDIRLDDAPDEISASVSRVDTNLDDDSAPTALQPETDTNEEEHRSEENVKTRLRRMGAALLARLQERETPPPAAETPVAKTKEKEASREAEPLRISFGSREAKAGYRFGNEPSEDYLLADPENRIFAVFDGMGGMEGRPDVAARVAAESAHERLARMTPSQTRKEATTALVEAFQNAREAVAERGEGGSTVGTIVKIITLEGKNVLAVAHAGDTRLIGYRKNKGTFRELVADQSNGNLVFNGLMPDEKGNGRDEYRFYAVEPDMRFMLCSDGITGDWEEEKLSDDEMKEAFGQDTPDDCAERFMKLSKKTDDKSVIVIDVDKA